VGLRRLIRDGRLDGPGRSPSSPAPTRPAGDVDGRAGQRVTRTGPRAALGVGQGLPGRRDVDPGGPRVGGIGDGDEGEHRGRDRVPVAGAPAGGAAVDPVGERRGDPGPAAAGLGARGRPGGRPHQAGAAPSRATAAASTTQRAPWVATRSAATWRARAWLARVRAAAATARRARPCREAVEPASRRSACCGTPAAVGRRGPRGRLTVTGRSPAAARRAARRSGARDQAYWAWLVARRERSRARACRRARSAAAASRARSSWSSVTTVRRPSVPVAANETPVTLLTLTSTPARRSCCAAAARRAAGGGGGHIRRGEDEQVRGVAPAAALPGGAGADQVQCVPGAGIGEVVGGVDPGPGRRRTAREDHRQRPAVLPPRARARRGGGLPMARLGQHRAAPGDTRRIPHGGRGRQALGPVAVEVARQGADQAEGLPLVGDGVRAGPAGEGLERPPAPGAGGPGPLAAGVGDEVAGGGRPHRIGGVHRQGLGEVVGEMARPLQVSGSGLLERLPRQAQLLPHGGCAPTCAGVRRRGRGAAAAGGLPLQGPAERERRPVPLHHPAAGARVRRRPAPAG